MYKLIAPALLASVVASTVSLADEATSKTGKPLTVQQEKMRNCNAEAKEDGMKGAERKAFMKECLKNEGAATASKAKSGKTPGASSP